MEHKEAINMQQVNTNKIVVQSNKLIEAHYKQEYTVQEQRMILWVISEIHKEDYINKDYEHKVIKVSAKRYAELIGITSDVIYREAQKIGNALMQKVIKIETEKGWKMFHWVETMEYKKGEGTIEILISPSIIPYLIDLKEKFTAFSLENILYLQSTHAIKLYQLLAQYKIIGERTIEVDELRSILGLNEIESYFMYKCLKQRVLEISKREINAKTNITFSYEEIKKSRKVVAIKFKITPKPNQEAQAKEAFEKYIATLSEGNTIKILFQQYGLNQGAVLDTFKKFTQKIVNYDPKSSQAIYFAEPEI